MEQRDLVDRLARHLPAEHAGLAEALAGEAADWAGDHGLGAGESPEDDARFRAIFDAVYDPLFVIDARANRIVEANLAAAQMLGYDRDELRSLAPTDMHPREQEYLEAFFAKVRRHGTWQTRELSCRRRSGDFLPAEMTATRTTLNGRECLVVVARDLREHQLALLGTAVSKIAHDLRNVLHSLHLFSRTLSRSHDPSVHRVVPRLQGTVDRAIRLCDATLAQGRIKEPTPEPSAIDLATLAEDVAVIAGLGGDGAMGWYNEIPAGLELNADANQLFRVLLNLCRNAVQAMAVAGGGGSVRVGARVDGSGVRIWVADEGPGVPQELEALLGEQERAPWRSGTGLGLSIASELVAAHGGRLELAESSSAGSRFELWLPDQQRPSRASTG